MKWFSKSNIFALVITLLSLLVFVNFARASTGYFRFQALDAEDEAINAKIKEALLQSPRFSFQFGAKIDQGPGTFCDKEFIYNIGGQGWFTKVDVDIDEGMQTMLDVEVGNIDFEIAAYQRGGLCVWKGAQGVVNFGKVASKVKLTINHEREFPDISLEEAFISGLSVKRMEWGIPILNFFDGDFPQAINGFIEQSTNFIASKILHSGLKEKLNRYLTEEIRKRVEKHIEDGGKKGSKSLP